MNTHIHMHVTSMWSGGLTSHNKEILSFTEIPIILEAFMPNEINEIHRESHHMVSFTYGGVKS